MTSGVELRAASFVPGTRGYTRPGSATSTRYTIPEEMRGVPCWFFNETGETMYIAFGGASVAVNDTTDSGVATEDLTAGGSEPQFPIANGQAVRLVVPANATKMALKCTDGSTPTGMWRFGRATGGGDTGSDAI